MTRKAFVMILVLAFTVGMISALSPGADRSATFNETCGPGFPACHASCQGLQWHQFLVCFNNCVAIHCS